jgi:hypothetical protein
MDRRAGFAVACAIAPCDVRRRVHFGVIVLACWPSTLMKVGADSKIASFVITEAPAEPATVRESKPRAFVDSNAHDIRVFNASFDLSPEHAVLREAVSLSVWQKKRA